MNTIDKPKVFTGYQVFMIVILAFIQFTVVLDFMVLSPLSYIVLDKLKINASQFSNVVSAYALSAGISGILAAFVADKFDRKKMLMFFYGGFILGTAMCALANTYESLLIARIVTGLFGGVMSAIGFAIIADIFKPEVRGRVMGFTQMAFSGSQILGIPIGLSLANHFSWQSPFWLIVGVSLIAAVVIVVYMKPITEHLNIKSERNVVKHFVATLSNDKYMIAFASTIVLATGAYMIMPFASPFTTGNIGIAEDDLPILYAITGVVSMIAGPIVGKLSDKVGKYPIFVGGTIIGIIMMGIYSHLGVTPLWMLMIINSILFIGVSSRIIASSALMTSIPNMQDRGTFMSINSSVQQISGAIGSQIAGMVVVKTAAGHILHYDTLGYVVMGTMTIGVVMMYFVNKVSKTVQMPTPKKESKVAVEA